MFTVNKYEANFKALGSKMAPRETTVTNFNKTHAGIKYNINGGGRDTYIYNDNGGFAAMHGPRQQDKGGGFLPTVNRSPNAAQKYTNAESMAKSIRYKQDGSGRDTYAVCGDGGFTNPDKASVAIDPRVAFARGLRGYHPDSGYQARRN